MIKTQLQGNLVCDPELKTVGTDNQTICVLTVASNRPGRDKPDVLRVEVWGKAGDACGKFLKKGSGIFASGDLELDLFTKDDVTRLAAKLVNAQVEFTDRRHKESTQE